MALGIIGTFIILLSMLVYCVAIYEIEIPDEPMTESEKRCSKIKLAIASQNKGESDDQPKKRSN